MCIKPSIKSPALTTTIRSSIHHYVLSFSVVDFLHAAVTETCRLFHLVCFCYEPCTILQNNPVNVTIAMFKKHFPLK